MMIILSEDEYNSLIKKEVHEKVVESLQEVITQDDAIISKLKEEVLHNRPCYQKGDNVYCDGCPLGFENLGICKDSKNYSKLNSNEHIKEMSLGRLF